MESATNAPSSSAITVVSRFLAALAAGDIDSCEAALTGDMVWRNIPGPTFRGKRRVSAAMKSMVRAKMTFGVDIHSIAASDDNSVVLTERTDHLSWGPVTTQFWVCGTFELQDGKIAVWRDHFAPTDLLRGCVTGTLNRISHRN